MFERRCRTAKALSTPLRRRTPKRWCARRGSGAPRASTSPRESGNVFLLDGTAGDCHFFLLDQSTSPASRRRCSTSCHRWASGKKLNDGIPARVLPPEIFQKSAPSV